VFVPGEAHADDQTAQTISGDSGSVDAAAAEKKLTRKEKRALRKKAKREKAKLAKADKKKKSGLICKREKVTGSNFPRKVCRTQEQIDAQREADQKSIRDINPAGGIGPG